jgi:hypothetical protein
MFGAAVIFEAIVLLAISFVETIGVEARLMFTGHA